MGGMLELECVIVSIRPNTSCEPSTLGFVCAKRGGPVFLRKKIRSGYCAIYRAIQIIASCNVLVRILPVIHSANGWIAAIIISVHSYVGYCGFHTDNSGVHDGHWACIT